MIKKDFRNCDFMKHLKLKSEMSYENLFYLYDKYNLTDEELVAAIKIFTYGKEKMKSYLPIDIFLYEALQIFIAEHIEIAKFEYIFNLSDLFHSYSSNLPEDTILVLNAFYESMFVVLTDVNNYNKFSYWLNHIQFCGLSDLDAINDYEAKNYLAENLIRTGLIKSVNSEAYNLALLLSIGEVLDDEYFLLLYKKSKYLFSDEFKETYNEYAKNKWLGIYINPLFEEYEIINSKIGYRINHEVNLYRLLQNRNEKFGYKIPEELIPFYLAYEMKNNV